MDDSWLGALMLRRLQFIGTTIRGRTNAEKELLVRDIASTVVPLVAEGRIRIAIDSVFGLDQHAEAYERLGATGKVGTVVLTANESSEG